MREIKFRAWDSRTKEWLFGYDYPNLGGFSMKGEIICLGEYSTFFQSIPITDWHKIILMQFTGKRDRNGEEIYEGDIVKSDFGDGKPVQILFGEYKDATNYTDDMATSIGFYWKESDGTETPFGNSINGDMSYCEIIGNIYENPELL